MSLTLSPFPVFYRPPCGTVDNLPVTRNGVHELPEGLLQPSAPSVFAELTMQRKIDGAISRGICGLLPATAFSGGRIRPHEQTLSARLQRQERLIASDRGALGKPILLTASNLDALWGQRNSALRPRGARTSFDGDFSSYRLDELTHQETTPVGLDLSFVDTLVIADGHHRAETHARLAATGNSHCAYVPVCLVDARELTIDIFGRFLPEMSEPVQTLHARLAPYFEILSVAKPTAPARDGTWLMTYRGLHYQLTWRKAPADQTTASGWMVGTVLKEALDITNPSTDARLEHQPIDVLPNGLLQLPDTQTLSFCGAPLSREVFFQEVAAGGTLPPKSTRFSPRVPSGLIVWKGCGA